MKKDNPVLFAKIDKEQYEAIRFIKLKEHKSLAKIVGEALSDFIKKKSKKYTIRIEI